MESRSSLNFNSNFGSWRILASEDFILSISLEKNISDNHDQLINALCKEAKSQLLAYFERQLKIFDLPLNTQAHTPFNQQVWSKVAEIPFGATLSYTELALQVNNLKAIRAVGTANGKNPFPIVIPCHRVIGKDGSLTGYAYGLELKRKLLVHEGIIADSPTLF